MPARPACRGRRLSLNVFAHHQPAGGATAHRDGISQPARVSGEVTKRSKEPSADAELKTFLDHHVTYELVQLEDAFMLARTEPVLGGRMNAYIESWAVHARSLNDFFNKRKPRDDDILALQYVEDAQYSPMVLPLPKDISAKFDKQIVHITSKRFLSPDQKLNLGARKSELRRRRGLLTEVHSRGPFAR